MMTTQKSSKHEFAIYYPRSSAFANQTTVEIADQQLFHRVKHILRLDSNDTIVLFDQKMHASCVIQSISKKSFTIFINNISQNLLLKPTIIFLLPLLKREALETAIYSLVETGVNIIQLVSTEKVQQKWYGSNEYERLFKIMIAAAEQSKNFAFPVLYEPVPFKEVIEKYSQNDYQKVYADPQGLPLQTILKEISTVNQLILMTGPEGDLSNQEKQFLSEANFNFCKLTPSILRSSQAVALLSGMMRSFFNL